MMSTLYWGVLGITLVNSIIYLIFLIKSYKKLGGYGLITGLVFPQFTVPILAFLWKTKTKEPWLVGKQALYWKIWAGLFPFIFVGTITFFAVYNKP